MTDPLEANEALDDLEATIGSLPTTNDVEGIRDRIAFHGREIDQWETRLEEVLAARRTKL